MLDVTLRGLLDQVERGEIVLPAMQRPFVWKDERIYRLIDSLLRSFPIGAVMLWRTDTIQRFRRIPRDIDVDIDEVFNFETSPNSARKYLVLDGQQRLTSLFAAFRGTYNHKQLWIDVLSGSPKGKDPGNQYYDCRFLSVAEAAALSEPSKPERQHFVPINSLISVDPVKANGRAAAKANELSVGDNQRERIIDLYVRCASALGSGKSLQVIPVDEDSEDATPIEEILEIFVRINSGGLVLLKSDLLMSLLDLKWNNIQPELQLLVRRINVGRPFAFTRDDVLKSLLLAQGAETRFDKLVGDRMRVEELAAQLPRHMEAIETAWQTLSCILVDHCRIHSERFFRGGHNALLPFVLYLSQHNPLSLDDRRRIVIGIYVAIMSGIFAGAEARMGSFARNTVATSDLFPLKELAANVRREYGIKTLDDLLRRHLDLALNIAHGGITIDGNPDDLQRDHIFPRSTLENEGYANERVNHYANFHFLRGSDNLNKSAKPPSEWFRSPGAEVAPYTDKDMAERLLTWSEIDPGQFEHMLEARSARIRQATEKIFGMSEAEFESLLAE